MLSFHQAPLTQIQDPFTERNRRREVVKDNRSVEVTGSCRESPVNNMRVFTFIHQASVHGNTHVHSIWSKQTPFSGPSSMPKCQAPGLQPVSQPVCSLLCLQ